MADQLHTVITQFRDSYLTELKNNLYNVFASLESKIRDTLHTSPPPTNDIQTIKNLLEEMKQSRNVIVQNPINSMGYHPFTSLPTETKYLTVFNDAPSSTSSVCDHQEFTTIPSAKSAVNEETSCKSSSTSIVDCEEPTKFTPLEIDGTTYWLDDDHIVYKETEEGYEEVGSFDPESGEVVIEQDDVEEEEEEEEEEAEEEEEEEEEGIETEEFIFKGQTYYRDSDNNVYNEDGEQLGIWNGKKIV